MKKSFLLIAALMLSLSSFSAFAQCNADLYSEKSMKSISQGFLFEKSFRIDGKGGRAKKIEYSCILSKDVNYSFIMNTKDGGATGLVFELLDSQRNKVATNFVNNKYFAGLEYKCGSTGIYYLSFSFKESQTQCGAAVLAFRR
jgi:hypothetical protein